MAVSTAVKSDGESAVTYTISEPLRTVTVVVYKTGATQMRYDISININDVGDSAFRTWAQFCAELEAGCQVVNGG